MTVLRKKPLVEAILELRWSALEGVPDAFGSVDDGYSLLLGRLFDKVRSRYPFHETLPTAQVPDHISAHLAKHRFRIAASAWPLIQLGPGLLTLNDTATYTWSDFRARALEAVNQLIASHPDPSQMRNLQVSLRYLDAIPLGDLSSDFHAFLTSKLKIGLQLPQTLFTNSQVSSRPEEFQWQSAYRANEPAGLLGLKLGLGTHNGVAVVVLDSSVISNGDDAPRLDDGFAGWLDRAHEVTSKWFKGLTAGELYASFDPE